MMGSGLRSEKLGRISRTKGAIMGHKVTVAYYSTTKGVTQQQTGAEMLYYGKVFKIPKPLFDEEGDVDFEKELNELIEQSQAKGLEPLLNETTVERYETWDMESEDVWVMYRMPCAKKES
jgi:hypothetical protein